MLGLAELRGSGGQGQAGREGWVHVGCRAGSAEPEGVWCRCPAYEWE